MGRLIIVSTPIGNLDDLSPRAERALVEADLVACEDTRRTGRLLARLGAEQRLVSVHEGNERQRVDQLMDGLAEGDTVALVTDAGTPLVSDPGFPVVREAVARQFTVEAVPGPSAVLAALVVSGLPPYPFTFCGFPPHKGGKRRRFYERFADLDHTLVVYVSPHRLEKSLADAETALGDRPAALCRELTKMHEEVVRGTLGEIREGFERRDPIRGEFVLVVGPPDD